MEEEIFKASLKNKGMNFTPARKVILEEIFSLHRHFDVDDLFLRLSRKKKKISRATIYRTLPLLVECSLIKEAVRCGEKITYEHTYGHKHHEHLICIKCGKIIEIKNKKLEELLDRICKKYEFTPVDHRVGIKGYCNKCKIFF